MCSCPRDRLGTVLDADLAVGHADVGLDCVATHLECSGDFSVRPASAQHGQDLCLPLSQSWESVSSLLASHWWPCVDARTPVCVAESTAGECCTDGFKDFIGAGTDRDESVGPGCECLCGQARPQVTGDDEHSGTCL